jgi:rare lipoprotein A
MLIATLREGSPAPAPSKVMIAAAKPFIANLDDGKDARVASASAKSFTLSSASTSVAKSTGDKSAGDKSAGETLSANRAKTKSLVRSASAVEPQPELPPPQEAPPAAFAPMRNEAGTLDLMSGRGLY